MTFFSNSLIFVCDAPRPWGVYFQDSASPQMEALAELHDNIMFYLFIILFAVAWIMVSIIRNYVKNKISHKYLNHGTLIELIWTVTPALILILIAFPSFKLLYLMDEVTDPSLTIFAEGHQWYWSYQYPDFLNNDDEELESDSYLIPESDMEDSLINHLMGDNVNRGTQSQLLSRRNAITCNHFSWTKMDVTLENSRGVCDFQVVRIKENNLDTWSVKAALAQDYHELASIASGGDIYYVCDHCFATACNPCFQAMYRTIIPKQ